MQFKIKNGTELEIDLLHWQFADNNLISIIGETKDSYRIEDQNKIEISLPREIISINDILVKNNQFKFSRSLYKQYFGDVINALEHAAVFSKSNGLRPNFARIVAYKELVFSRAEYFSIKPEIFFSGAPFNGGFKVCLGGLLESWISSDDLLIKNHAYEGDLYLSKLGGSPLTGAYSACLWSFDNNEFVIKNTSQGAPSLTGGVLPWLKKLSSISELYPYEMDLNYLAIRKLMNEIDELDGNIETDELIHP